MHMKRIGAGYVKTYKTVQALKNVNLGGNMEKMAPAGRSYWIAHPELSQLPLCGPGGPAAINKKPDLESVLSVKPRVIFATYMDSALTDEVQKTLGIPVVVLTYGSLATFDERVYDSLRLAGRILNRKKRTETVMAYIKSLKKDIQDRALLWFNYNDLSQHRYRSLSYQETQTLGTNYCIPPFVSISG